MKKTYEDGKEDGKREERLRIANELDKNPFRWCNVCRDILCRCRG